MFGLTTVVQIAGVALLAVDALVSGNQANAWQPPLEKGPPPTGSLWWGPTFAVVRGAPTFGLTATF
jgi:hypothetical protein